MSQGFARTNIMGAIARDAFVSTIGSVETNLAVASRTGTTITANASINTVGNYTTLIAATARDAFGVWLTAWNVAVSATATSQLLNLALGGAGAEANFITNINTGYASLASQNATTVGCKLFYFPGLLIPSGSRISANLQALISADTVQIGIFVEERAQWHIATSDWKDYGADTANSKGTAVTPGNGAFGNWTSIGSTTSREHKLWTIGIDGNATTAVTSSNAFIEIGYGPNAGAVTSMGFFQADTGGAEAIGSVWPAYIAFDVASGSQLWCRIAHGATTAFGVIIYGN